MDIDGDSKLRGNFSARAIDVDFAMPGIASGANLGQRPLPSSASMARNTDNNSGYTSITDHSKPETRA